MTNAQRVASAIKKFVNEHAAPNAVSPGELSAYYVQMTPLAIGLCAWEAQLLLRDAGYQVGYENRRFVITSAPTA